MKNFRTYQIAVEFYHLTQNLTLKRHLKDQLDRAASSIVLNLAEGRGKPTVKDQKRFFHISMGSLRECQAILALANMKQSKESCVLDKLGAHLYLLIKCAR